MALMIGRHAPDFDLDAMHQGEFSRVRLADYRGRWLVVLFYPLDFTFVCPTELCAFSDRLHEFTKLGADVLGVSVDSKFTHLAWYRTLRRDGGIDRLRYPLAADLGREMATAYRVLTDAGVALRGLFVIDPDGVVQHATLNNLSVGRSVDETLRLLQACQFTRENGEVCPADWQPGEEAIVPDVASAREFFRMEHSAA
jgi:peroxiredoxin (alkyl hydroperoxide reductase subunit C)